jgi:hypothetical protein
LPVRGHAIIMAAVERPQFPLGWFAVVAAAWGLLMVCEAWSANGLSGPPLEPDAARTALTTFSRANNTLVQILFAAVALAVPITATAYTPKLLWLFMTDRIHQSALTFYALAAAHAIWVMQFIRRGEAHPELVNLVMVSSVIGFLLAVPYLLYVIWFLDPSSVVRRLEGAALRAAARMTRSPADQAASRSLLPNHLYHLGGVILKSIDRVDRQTAAEGIQAIRAIVASAGERKSQLPQTWFNVGKREFRGLSREALSFISSDRTWIEVQALQQLQRAFDASLGKMPDSVSAVADAVRGIGVDAVGRNDPAALEAAMRTFNSFLRTALRQSHGTAIFAVLHQYRALAEDLATTRPEYAVLAAGHLRRYGKLARQHGTSGIAELFIHDLGTMLRHATADRSPAQPGIFEAFLGYAADLSASPTLPLASAILVVAGELLRELPESESERMLALIDRLPRTLVDEVLGLLEATDQPRDWELSERQLDPNFLPPMQIEALRARLEQRVA